MKYFASCPKGLEPQLLTEINDCHIDRVQQCPGGVAFDSSEKQLLELIMNSRIAGRVFMTLYKFKMRDEKDLYQQALKEKWNHVFNLNQTFKISTLLDGPSNHKFHNSLYLSKLLKDAIADNFKRLKNKRPSVSTKNPDIRFLLRIEKEKFASILLDLCGTPLSMRGYRSGHHLAPMRENLAAGIVLNLDWQETDQIFIDSMCGTGTLLIEAALIKGKISPSYLKIIRAVEQKSIEWDFQRQKWFVQHPDLPLQFKKILASLYQQNNKRLSALPDDYFWGNDLDLRDTQANLAEAKLKNKIQLTRNNSQNLAAPNNRTGIIICNPPYGNRMEEEQELEELYHQYGEALKNNFKNFKAYIFTGNPNLRKKISLRTSKRVTLFNGNIECRLLEYRLY